MCILILTCRIKRAERIVKVVDKALDLLCVRVAIAHAAEDPEK